MRRWVPHLVTLGALALALSPLLGRADRQSVPLSTYPMYAADRGPIVAFPTVRAWPAGTTSGPDRVPIGVLGTDDPLVAVTRLNQAISAGETAMASICRAALAESGPATAAVELVTERHDAVARLENRPSLVGETVHLRCERT